MTPTFRDVTARLDGGVVAAFEPARINLKEAGVKAAEMNKHLVEAVNLSRFGFREDAFARYEDATMAGAGALLALTGGRVSYAYRGREHEVKKHFIVAGLEAAGHSTPPLEKVLLITRLRHLVEYNVSAVEEYLTPQAADEARQTCDVIRRSILALLGNAGVVVPEIKPQTPTVPDGG